MFIKFIKTIKLFYFRVYVLLLQCYNIKFKKISGVQGTMNRLLFKKSLIYEA